MIHYAFLGATALIATVGIGGTIALVAALVFLGPAAVSAFLTPLLAKFLACRWCDVAVAVFLALVASYWIGHHTAAAECRADALTAELAIKQADLDNATKAKDDAIARAATIESHANAHAATDAKYIASLKKRPSCALDDSDIGTGGMRNYGFHFTLPSRSAK